MAKGESRDHLQRCFLLPSTSLPHNFNICVRTRLNRIVCLFLYIQFTPYIENIGSGERYTLVEALLLHVLQIYGLENGR